MTGKEQAAMIFGVWAFVYASVLGFDFLLAYLGIELEFWLETLISTFLTVPFITYVAVPWVKRLIARAENKPVEALGDPAG